MEHKLWHKTLETLPIASRAQSPREDEEQSPIAKILIFHVAISNAAF